MYCLEKSTSLNSTSLDCHLTKETGTEGLLDHHRQGSSKLRLRPRELVDSVQSEDENGTGNGSCTILGKTR